MAILMSWLVDTAAQAIGDEFKTRVKPAHWARICTLAISDVCSLYNLVEYEDEFDLPKDGLVTYPDQAVLVTELRVSATPSDDKSFVKLDQMWEDEWNDEFGKLSPQVSDVPKRYFADKGLIRLDALLDANVADGGRIMYYGVPDEVTDPATYYLPAPDFMRSFVLERMQVYALRFDERDAEAADVDRMNKLREDEMRTKIDQRTLDRREQIRPTSTKRKYGGMA